MYSCFIYTYVMCIYVSIVSQFCVSMYLSYRSSVYLCIYCIVVMCIYVSIVSQFCELVKPANCNLWHCFGLNQKQPWPFNEMVRTHTIGFWEAAKNVLLLGASPPPPSSLEHFGHIFFGFFFRASKKVIFLSGPAFSPPPLLVAGPLKKTTFFSGSLKWGLYIYKPKILYINFDENKVLEEIIRQFRNFVLDNTVKKVQQN